MHYIIDEGGEWIAFSGEVPRIGERVTIMSDSQQYYVYKVKWYLTPHKGSEARVYVHKIKEE